MRRACLLSATVTAAVTFAALALGAGAPAFAEGATNSSTSTSGEATSGSTATASEATGESKVAAACLEELDAVEQGMNEDGRVVAGRQLRTLHEAATIFAQAGLADACASVVEGIRSYGEQHGTDASMTDQERSAFAESLQSATPLSEVDSRLRAGSLIGDTVVGLNGEPVGDVDDVLISSDSGTRYVLIGSGGFFGIGEDFVPVRIQRLRFVDQDTLALAVDAATFNDAPRVDVADIDGTVDEWSRDVELWWDERVGSQKAKTN